MGKFIEMVLRAAKEGNDRREAEAAKLVADPMAEAKVDAIAAEFEKVDRDFYMKNEKHNLLPRMKENRFAMEDADELIGLITYATRATLKVSEFLARLDALSDSFAINPKLGKKADGLTLHMMAFIDIVDKMMDDMLATFHNILDLNDEDPQCDDDDEDEDDPCEGCSGCTGEELGEPDDMDAVLAKAKT